MIIFNGVKLSLAGDNDILMRQQKRILGLEILTTKEAL